MFRTNVSDDVGAAKTHLRTFTPKDLRLTTSDTARHQTVKCDSLIAIVWSFLNQARHHQGPSLWVGIKTLVQNHTLKPADPRPVVDKQDIDHRFNIYSVGSMTSPRWPALNPWWANRTVGHLYRLLQSPAAMRHS